MWKIYDTLLQNIPESGTVSYVDSKNTWSLAELSGGGMGVAMTTAPDTRPTMFPSLLSLPAAEAARAVKSWNFPEASSAMAIINACYNTPQHLEFLKCQEPYANYCTRGLSFAGKTVGIVGHLKMPEDTLKDVKEAFILERNPRPGDYPDSACEYMLPKCDFVIITACTLVNKTLPRLLELCRNAYTILAGPTAPMCPQLLGCGINRIAGMVAMDYDGVRRHIQENRPIPPYAYGETFLLSEESL